MKLPFEVQTRTHCGELKYWASLKDAFIYADSNGDVWKISFPVGLHERCRLIKKDDEWIYEDIMNEVAKGMEELINDDKK